MLDRFVASLPTLAFSKVHWCNDSVYATIAKIMSGFLSEIIKVLKLFPKNKQTNKEDLQVKISYTECKNVIW